MKQKQEPQIYIRDPRFAMTIGGRFLIRVVSGAAYVFFGVAAITTISSDVLWLRWTGAFLLLMLLDRFVHAKEGDVPITELHERADVDVAKSMTPHALRVLERAYERSMLRKTHLDLEILKGLLHEKETKEGLIRLDVLPEEFGAKLDDILERTAGEDAAIPRKEYRALKDAELEEIAKAAFIRAKETGRRFVDTFHIFFALAVRKGHAGKIFGTFEIDPGDLGYALLFSRERQGILEKIPSVLGGFVFESERHRKKTKTVNRAWTSRPTPTLDRYATDLTELARRGRAGFLIGHKEEYNRLVETLSRPSNPNALLVGEAGAGKDTLLERLAFDISRDEVPGGLFDKRLVSLDISRLIAGAPPEELHARLGTIIDEILAAGNVVLVIPDIHNLVRTSGSAYISVADALIPVLRNDAFPVVGITYPLEFKQDIEARSDFKGTFEVIRVNEISEDEAKTVLVYFTILLEGKTGRVISFGAVKTAVRLAVKYFRDTPLPGSAQDLLKSAASLALRKGEKVVNSETVITAASEKTSVPVREAEGEEREKLLRLEEIIHERLVDQEEAVAAVADALREYRSGLEGGGAPIANFLFVGPTGVGKTELAKTLAEIQFGSESALLRFDMTEYQEPGSITRFIGSPDGKVRGGLADAVREKPYSVILLDEFEKAHQDIMELFLQVLDDGRLTDGLGRVVRFENTIIIATSNAHSDIIVESLRQGEKIADIADYVKQRLVDVFKPELLNRFSKIVVFKNLEMSEVKQIAAIKLRKLASSLDEKGITVQFDDSVVTEVAKKGYEPAFGARPVNRAIDEHIKSGLAKFLLERDVPRGSGLRVSFVDGEAVFEVVE